MHYCPYCGASIAPDYVACPHCGKMLRGEPAAPPRGVRAPENYMAHAAILGGVSFFICWLGIPFALLSLYYGDQVDRLWRSGDHDAATAAAANARKWFKRGVWSVIIFYLLLLLGVLILIAGIAWLGWFSTSLPFAP